VQFHSEMHEIIWSLSRNTITSIESPMPLAQAAPLTICSHSSCSFYCRSSLILFAPVSLPLTLHILLTSILLNLQGMHEHDIHLTSSLTTVSIYIAVVLHCHQFPPGHHPLLLCPITPFLECGLILVTSGAIKTQHRATAPSPPPVNPTKLESTQPFVTSLSVLQHCLVLSMDNPDNPRPNTDWTINH